MTRVVKEIGGRKYLYEVVWDSEEKRQVWKYRGKVGGDKESKPNPDELRERIYHEISRELGSKLTKKDLKRLRGAIKRALK